MRPGAGVPFRKAWSSQAPPSVHETNEQKKEQ
jgi:hypothetical protein